MTAFNIEKPSAKADVYIRASDMRWQSSWNTNALQYNTLNTTTQCKLIERIYSQWNHASSSNGTREIKHNLNITPNYDFKSKKFYFTYYDELLSVNETFSTQLTRRKWRGGLFEIDAVFHITLLLEFRCNVFNCLSIASLRKPETYFQRNRVAEPELPLKYIYICLLRLLVLIL